MAESHRCTTLFPKGQFLAESEVKPGAFGVHDTLRDGFSSVRNNATPSHLLEHSEKNFLKNKQQQELAVLRNTQGLHMPMKLQMERTVAARIQRLPGLPSSRIALQTLLELDDQIGFEDMLYDPSRSEVMIDYRATWEMQQGLI